jgi:hypothetical protein
MFRRFTILTACFAILTSACSLSTILLPGAATKPEATVVSLPGPTPTLIPTATVAELPVGTPAVPAATNIGETPDPRLFTASDMTFNLIIPDGWVVQDRGGAYPDLQGPDENGIRPVISFYEEQTEYALDRYADIYQDSFISQNTGYQAIGEETLSTTNGDAYLRWGFSNFLQGHILAVITHKGKGDRKLCSKVVNSG